MINNMCEGGQIRDNVNKNQIIGRNQNLKYEVEGEYFQGWGEKIEVG